MIKKVYRKHYSNPRSTQFMLHLPVVASKVDSLLHAVQIGFGTTNWHSVHPSGQLFYVSSGKQIV